MPPSKGGRGERGETPLSISQSISNVTVASRSLRPLINERTSGRILLSYDKGRWKSIAEKRRKRSHPWQKITESQPRHGRVRSPWHCRWSLLLGSTLSSGTYDIKRIRCTDCRKRKPPLARKSSPLCPRRPVLWRLWMKRLFGHLKRTKDCALVRSVSPR